MVKLRRTKIILKPDSSRVLVRPFIPNGSERIQKIIGRVFSLSDAQILLALDEVQANFGDRHEKTETFFLDHYELVKHHLFTDNEPSMERRLLLGAYLTSEYALESAALFNPSIVAHPDQSGLDEGYLRFIMSLRATGEGHISSIEFREGTVDRNHTVVIQPAGRFVSEPDRIDNPEYERALFERKLIEMGFKSSAIQPVITSLDVIFDLESLFKVIDRLRHITHYHSQDGKAVLDAVKWLALSNYEVHFYPEQPVSERIIFPNSPSQLKGIEDTRFVRFINEDGTPIYYATFTAYDGNIMLPQMLETTDFLHFRIITLNGPMVQNKGMALFPRKLNGLYCMISRQDNENLYIMYSEHLHFWYEAKLLMRPTYTWEYIQIGNCGSPIETAEGWLMLTHGVGPMRRYCIGAVLLDLEDPTRVIGRLRTPLISPNENEREGYVPNVVYTCGAICHEDCLIIPYAMSDYATRMATVSLSELLKEMKK